MQGLHERIKVVKVCEPKAETSTVTGYNGHNVTTGAASGIDTQGFDEAMLVLSLGAIAGGALDVDLYECATDDASAATAMTNAAGAAVDFDQKTSAHQNNTYVIRYRPKDKMRYLFVVITNSTTDSKTFGINVLLGDADSMPVTQEQTVDFADSTP